MSQKKIAKDTLNYFLSQLIFQGFSVLRGLFLPNILEPFHYGIVSTLNIIERYSIYANLGIHSAALYKIPALKSQNNSSEIQEIKNNVFYFTLFTGAAATIGIIIFAILNRGWLIGPFFWGLLIVSFTPLLLNLRGIFMIFLRADKNFNLVSKVIGLGAFFSFILTILLGLFFKSPGVLFAQILVLFICVLIMLKQSGYVFYFKFKAKKISEFLKFGIYIFFIVGLLATFITTVDKLTIAKYLGATFVGFYSIGLTLKGTLQIVSYSINVVASTTLIEKYGDPKGHPQDYFLNMTYLAAIVTAFFIGLFSLSSPYIIKIIFPKYEAGISSAQVLVFAAYFEDIGGLSQHVAVMNKLRTHIASLLIWVCVAYVGFNFTFIKNNIFYVSIAIVGLSALNNFSTLLIASSVTFKNIKYTLRFLRNLIGLLFFVGLACWLINRYLPGYNSLSKIKLLQSVFLKLIVFSIIYSPILLYFIRRKDFVRNFCIEFMGSIKQKFFSMDKVATPTAD